MTTVTDSTTTEPYQTERQRLDAQRDHTADLCFERACALENRLLELAGRLVNDQTRDRDLCIRAALDTAKHLKELECDDLAEYVRFGRQRAKTS